MFNHQCGAPTVFAPYLWGRLEEAVVARWAANMTQREADVFDAYVRNDLGVADAAARAAFRDIAVSGMEANLQIQTVAAFDAAVDPAQLDRPTAK